MNSTAISGREAEVLEAVRSRDLVVFSPSDVERFLGLSARNTYRILGRMADKGLVERLTRGTYVLSETYESLDSYVIVSHLEPASYVGFVSGLHFHEMTAQVPRRLFVAVTKQKRPMGVQGQDVRFVRVDAASFFGYDRYGIAVVSDPEKTILDCLRLQDYSGGIRLVYDALSDDLDVERLVRYAERLESGAVAARAGYLLERKGLLEGGERLRTLVSSYTRLDPTGPRANPVADWQLYANVSLDD